MNAVVATHGERVLMAVISGFFFLLGATLAMGALAAARRAVRAWRLRRWQSEVDEEVTIDGGFAFATAVPPAPPPIPSRWLN